MGLTGNRRNTMSQTEITNWIESIIPADLMKEYAHLSYGEMAEVEELMEWKEQLLQAESEWFE